MAIRDDILWFKKEFLDKIDVAVESTPFTSDLITAIACQETGFLWRTLRAADLPTAEILRLCAGIRGADAGYFRATNGRC